MSDRPTSHVHWRVRNVAVAMAHELYDHMMMDNEWYARWRSVNPGMSKADLEEAFVKRNLPKLIPQARAMLTQMLKDSSDVVLKEAIYDALVKDATLVRGRVN
jgi:hypothetical protein